MKKIIFYQKGSEPIIIYDDDNSDLKLYTNNLSSIMENNNLSVIQVKDASVIIRPSKIISVFIQDQNLNKKEMRIIPNNNKIDSKKDITSESEKKESLKPDNEYLLTDE